MTTLLRKFRSSRRRSAKAGTYWMQMYAAMERRRPRPEHVRAHAVALGQKRLICATTALPGFSRYGLTLQWLFNHRGPGQFSVGGA